MKELLARLIEVQKMEAEAEKIQTAQKNLPTRLHTLEAEFQVVCEAIEHKRKEFDEKQKQKREKERQLQAGQEALKRTRDRLSEVKTNKEYQSMLKEIETSLLKNGKLEDEIISLLDGLEGLAGEMKSEEQVFEVSRRSYEEEKQMIQARIGSLTGKLDDCLLKSEKLKMEMPADIIKKYEKIKKVVGNGVAVVPVWKEVCYGCHMAIPPQMYNELQTLDEIVTCPNCNRIIYWEDRTG